MDFDTRYKKLNAAQKEAVDYIEGPLMVIAGPGTGKTELLSMRTANILKKTDTLPQNILCLTFTESGAEAMRKRLTEIIGADAYKVAIHTFHSFGSEVINRYGEYFYSGASFRPADELSTYTVLQSIFDELEYDNPLAAKMGDEYVYLSDVMQAISELKKSGLTHEELLQILDANDQALDTAEPLVAKIFADRITKSTASALVPVANQLAALPITKLPPGISPLANIMALSLARAVDSAEESNTTKSITAWKNEWCEKNTAGQFVFKDRKRSEKLRALSYIYYQYLIKMQAAQLYDFDDMVLQLVHTMETQPDLRYNLQELYLYIMVDEFQDTNLAQSRILNDLTLSETGDEPNLMVVGDDDQAIYSFQGAELSNILNFAGQFKTTKKIVLTENYRSDATILQNARQVITQSQGRLEEILGVDKTLQAHHKATTASVELHEYARVEDEYAQVAKEIHQSIKSGTAPHDIVVLARRHRELMGILPYLNSEGVEVSYERRDNVLDSEVVKQLTLVAQIVTLLAAQDFDEANSLLPQLVAHPAWGFDPESVLRLSLTAYKDRKFWLEVMSDEPSFAPLALWLAHAATQSLVQPAERMLDILIGTTNIDENEFVSPLYGYFFSEHSLAEEPDLYLIYLEALRKIRAQLRDFQTGTDVKLSDFVDFIDLHHQTNRPITSVRSYKEHESAISLMTAHKAKGLEYKHVYIIGAVDTTWGERVRTRSRLITYPENLPLSPSGDSLDERLRLFFVAMTRARDTLSISYSLQDENRALERASFLISNAWDAVPHPAASGKTLEHELVESWYQPLVAAPQQTIKALLAPQLERYKLSATHLNNFLDVSIGGPEYFLINNLLRFPQEMSPHAAYGSAIHRTLQQAHSHLRATHTKKPVEDILSDFETNLAMARLSEADFKHFARRGVDALNSFLAVRYDSFRDNDQPELSFASQQSVLGDARLTGALDLVRIDKSSMTIDITDYKTGKPAHDWKGKTEYDKIKLHKYRQQLMFYKLLVENSRDYRQYSVNQSVLSFVEPDVNGAVLALSYMPDAEELDRFKQLVQVVFRKITTFDLPDVTNYSADYKGIVAFEQDLLDDMV